jgi:hypothetical protein
MRRTSTPAISGFPTHFVVDGSNIATEGRNAPSLHQLNEAVLAFMEEHPGVLITVVVDATFGHRIDKKEVKEFDLAVANNELVTPPAGAVGRGDAFVLSIANKAKAGILSNDSFQEFHGQYDWLFEPARLIGGKPVPHVGWVFVERTPVRGPKSRAAVKDAKRAENGEAPATTPGRRPRRGSSSGSPLANEPLPVPTTPPPGRPVAAAEPAAAPAEPAGAPAAAATPAPPSSKSAVNDLVPFLDFVERHPVGTSCTAVIESYSSHGAYARSDSVLVYIPLRLMDDPAPRSARSVLKLGEAVALVVVGYAPERRSIDCALPNMAPAAAAAPEPTAEAQPAKRPRRGSKAAKAEQAEETASITAAAVEAAEPAPAKPSRRRGSKAAAPAVEPATEPSAEQPAGAAPAPVKRSRSSRAAKAAAPAAEATASAEAAPAAKRTPAKKTAARATKAAAKKTADAPAASEAPAKKAAAKKTAAKKAPAKKTPAKKAAAG